MEEIIVRHLDGIELAGPLLRGGGGQLGETVTLDTALC
jgi:hypothetical protein